MKILIVAPSLRLGGLENAASTMANWLSHVGHEVFFVLCYKSGSFYELSSNVEILAPDFSHSKNRKGVFYIRWLFFVRNEITRLSPDVILSYGDYHSSLVSFANLFNDSPLVISDRASPGLSFPVYMRLIRNIAYPFCSGVIAQTERAAFVKRKLARNGVRISVIPNPVRSFEPSLKVDREKVVLAAARHYHVKGLDRLVHAFSKVNAPDWQLHIAGSPGPETKNLEEQVVNLGLAGRVKFLGGVQDMAAIYSSAGIYVLPSRSEGFPNALIEAMSLGCPSVAFDINAGPSEIISNGVDGILVPDGDIDAMSGVIQRLVDNPLIRSSLSSEAIKIKDNLSLDSIGRKYESFLKTVAGK